MQENEMVFVKKDNMITSGGYEVDSYFLNNDIPVTYNLNDKMFGGLAVPSGLVYLTNTSNIQQTGGATSECKTHVGHNLYDKLVGLAQGDKNKINLQDKQDDVLESADESTATEDIREDSPINEESDAIELKKKTKTKKNRNHSKRKNKKQNIKTRSRRVVTKKLYL